MLQVLCQLLGTSNLEDVQSWLVSASPAEKDQARSMINSALRGLKESERTSNQTQQPVDFNSLSNFVERQKNEERYASQRYIEDSLNRSAPILPSITEEQQTDTDLNDTWTGLERYNHRSKLSPQNAMTDRCAHRNYNHRSFTSFDRQSSNKQNDSFYKNEQNQRDDDNEEHIDTIQLDDDRRQSRSASFSRPKIQSQQLQSPSSHRQKHRIESMQFHDDDDNLHLTNTHETKNTVVKDEHKNEHQEQIVASSSKKKMFSNQNEQNKSRKIRELQNKLSRQEEESKKLFNELQSKQSRLENAIKLLVKQTSSYKKRRQPTLGQVEDLEAPVVNVIIQSPRETNSHDKPNETNTLDKQQELSSVHSNGNFKKNQNSNIGTRIGDYNIEDVKVQINLSRLDNRQTKVYSGVWKPDMSTLYRLQGN